MPLAMYVSVFTFTVVTLTVGALYNTGSPDAMAAVSVSVSIPVTPDNHEEGELEENNQDQSVHSKKLGEIRGDRQHLYLASQGICDKTYH